jgi:hypothetical protein
LLQSALHLLEVERGEYIHKRKTDRKDKSDAMQEDGFFFAIGS